MTLVIGFCMLGIGLFALSIVARQREQYPAAGELNIAALSQMIVLQILILGGLGILIGESANLIAGP